MTWADFGLSVALCCLFLVSWAGHGISAWQQYVQSQQQHGEPVEVSGYLREFSASTLENWQSEFLPLFPFVVLAALLIHRGSSESKDSDDRMEADAGADRAEARHQVEASGADGPLGLG